MSSIITAILRSTMGLFCDKARNSAANKLRDRDLADEKLREVIVKDLTYIKSKLDCLSLKDLHSSYSFLKEGFHNMPQHASVSGRLVCNESNNRF